MSQKARVKKLEQRPQTPRWTPAELEAMSDEELDAIICDGDPTRGAFYEQLTIKELDYLIDGGDVVPLYRKYDYEPQDQT